MSNFSAIALCAPIIASNAIFSVRRANRSAESFEENPLYSVANANIALAQVLKGARAIKAISIATTNDKMIDNVLSIKNASKKVKTLSNNKLAKGLYKTINFTADHINPIICLASGINVLAQDDKVDALARESLALTTMFAAENFSKKLIGMPSFSSKNLIKKNPALYKKSPLLTKTVNGLMNVCNSFTICNKKVLKGVPGLLKGLFFACSSIIGYKTGNAICNKILGEKEKV